VPVDYDRQMMWFAADYEVEPAQISQLPRAVQVIKDAVKPEKWTVQEGWYHLYQPQDRIVWSIANGRIAFRTLGATPSEFLRQSTAPISAALSAVGARATKRLGLKLSVFVPLKMTHTEMVELMFGSYLVPPKELRAPDDKIDDVAIHLYGTRNGLKYHMEITPQSDKQVGEQVRGNPNLRQFLGDEWLDSGVRDFLSRVVQDALLVDVDVYAHDESIDMLESFLKRAMATAHAIVEEAVARCQSTQTEG
jgi:hypothetical protein